MTCGVEWLASSTPAPWLGTPVGLGVTFKQMPRPEATTLCIQNLSVGPACNGMIDALAYHYDIDPLYSFGTEAQDKAVEIVQAAKEALVKLLNAAVTAAANKTGYPEDEIVDELKKEGVRVGQPSKSDSFYWKFSDGKVHACDSYFGDPNPPCCASWGFAGFEKRYKYIPNPVCGGSPLKKGPTGQYGVDWQGALPQGMQLYSEWLDKLLDAMPKVKARLEARQPFFPNLPPGWEPFTPPPIGWQEPEDTQPPPPSGGEAVFQWGVEDPRVEGLQKELNALLTSENFNAIPITKKLDAATCGAMKWAGLQLQLPVMEAYGQNCQEYVHPHQPGGPSGEGTPGGTTVKKSNVGLVVGLIILGVAGTIFYKTVNP